MTTFREKEKRGEGRAWAKARDREKRERARRLLSHGHALDVGQKETRGAQAMSRQCPH